MVKNIDRILILIRILIIILIRILTGDGSGRAQRRWILLREVI
jgi:hypothetical protein